MIFSYKNMVYVLFLLLFQGKYCSRCLLFFTELKANVQESDLFIIIKNHGRNILIMNSCLFLI